MHVGIDLFNQREEMRRRLYEVVKRFRQKGAVSPDKAMTAEELGLPPRFEEAMKRAGLSRKWLKMV